MTAYKRSLSALMCLILIFSVFFGFNVNIYAATGQTITVNLHGKYNQTQARTMLTMVNNFRRSTDAWYWNSDNKTKAKMTNLYTLQYDYELEKVAMKRAAEIAVSFSHTRPNGDSCFTAFPSSKYYAMGENIAMGYNMLTTPYETYVAFREDNENYAGQGHRRNMLSPSFSAVGFACFIYQGAYYWVQEFGTPAVNTASVKANDNDASVPVELLTSMVSNAWLGVPTQSVKVTAGSSVGLPEANLVLNIPGRDIVSYVTATVVPSYSSSNTNVASVSAGKVSGVAPGTATITASLLIGNLKPSANISVTVECNHSFFKDELRRATHKERGLVHKRCTKCGYEITEEVPRLSYYTDVRDVSWYFDSVDTCTELGFLSGYGNGTFGPNDKLKRQDFVVILARLCDADLTGFDFDSGRLSDIKKGKYYTPYVNWAVDNNIISGYANGKFGVNDPITREQICTILYRYMNSPEVSDAASTYAKFRDSKNVSAFAYTPVAWALQNGVISGMSSDRLAPTETASRAQIAAIIMNLYNNGMFA